MYSQQRADPLTVSRPGQRSGGAANHGFAAVQCAPGDGNAAPFRPFSQIANISQNGSQQQALAASLHAPMPRAPSASQGSNNSFTQQPHQSQHQNRNQQHNMGGVIGLTSTSGASGLPQALVRPFSAGSRPMGHSASITAAARPISAPAQPTRVKAQLASRPTFASLSMRPALGSGGTVTPTTGCAAGLSATATTVTSAVVNFNGHINMSQKSDDRELYHGGFSASQGSAGMSFNDCVQFRSGAANRSRGAAWLSAQCGSAGPGGGGAGAGGGGSDGGVVANIRVSRISSGATNGPRPRSANATQRQEQPRPYSAPNYYEPDVEPYDRSAALENYAAAHGSQQQHGLVLPASQVEEPLLPFPLASGPAAGGVSLGVAGLAQEIQLRKRQDAGAIATAAAVVSKVPGDSIPQQTGMHQSESFALPARLEAHHNQVISEPHGGQMLTRCELPLNTQEVQESGSSAAAAAPLPPIAPPNTNIRCAAEAAAASQQYQGGYAAADSRCGAGQGLAPGLSQQEQRVWSLQDNRQDQAPQLHQQGRLLSPSDEQQLQLQLPQFDQKLDDPHQREERRRRQERQSNKLQIPNQQQTGPHCHGSRQPEERYLLSQVTEEVQQPTPDGALPQRLPSPPHPALRRLHQQLHPQEPCQQQEQRLAVLTSSQEPHQHQQLQQVLRRSLEDSQSHQELTRGDVTKELDCRVVTQMRKGNQQQDQEEEEAEDQCLLVHEPAHHHRLQPQRRQEQMPPPAETAAAPFGSGPPAHGAMLETCYSELRGALNCIAARTARVEEAMQVCQKIAATMPEVISLLHQQNVVLQGLRTAQEDAAVAATTAAAAMERRFAQALLPDEGGQRRLGGGGGVDATAQTSPSLTLLPPDPAASGLRLTGSGAPEPRALFQGPPEGVGIGAGPGVAVGVGMGNGRGAVAGVGDVNVGGGVADGGTGAPRCRIGVGTHLQLTTTTTTTTTTTVYEEEEEEEEQQPVGNNREEVVGDEEQNQGSGGQAVRPRLDGTCHTPASKGNGVGTVRRVRSVVRVRQTHTQHHCSVLEHELFPVELEQQEYSGEALQCEGLRLASPSPQSPLSVQHQRRCGQPTKDGDAQAAHKGGPTGWGQPSSSPQRQPPRPHFQESCQQAHLLRQPQNKLQTETRPRQKEQVKQQNQDPMPQKRHRAEEGRMAEVSVRPPYIQVGAKGDAQGRVGVGGVSSGAAGAGGRTAPKKGGATRGASPASLPLDALLPSAAVTMIAAQPNRCRGSIDGNRTGKPFADAGKPLPEAVAPDAAAPEAGWETEEVLPLALRREKRNCRKPEGRGGDAGGSLAIPGTGGPVLAKEPGVVMRRSTRQCAKLGDGVPSGPLNTTAVINGTANVAVDAETVALKKKAPTKPAERTALQWKRKADLIDPNVPDSEHPQPQSAAEQPDKRAGCGGKKPHPINYQITIEQPKGPQAGGKYPSTKPVSSGGPSRKVSREGASKYFTRSGGRRREPTTGLRGNGGGDNGGVVAAATAAGAAPTNDNDLKRMHETTTGMGPSDNRKKAAKAAPALIRPEAVVTGRILCGGNGGNDNAVAVEKRCGRVVPATDTRVSKGAAGRSGPGKHAQDANALAIPAVVVAANDDLGSSGVGVQSTDDASADGWNERDIDTSGTSYLQALPTSLQRSLAGRSHSNRDDEADEFARLVAARMLRHRQKRMKGMVASTQGAAGHL